MILYLRNILAILLIVNLAACKNSGQHKKDSRDDYSNIDLDKIFTKADSHLADKAAIRQGIASYYTRIWEGNDLWGGILVAKGDDILFEKYRGYTQPYSKKPVTENTPLHVASVSKTLTTMAVLKLIEAKKVRFEDPLTKFFPGFPYPEVTVFSLLSQRSGLPKYEYFIDKIKPQPAALAKKFLTNRDVLDLLIRYKPELARKTNTGFMYCNTNFALLALIVEQKTGRRFPEAMQEMIFKPLKMKHTFIFQEKDTATAARSFYARGPVAFRFDKLDLIYGDKNVFTTPRDLLNFSKALYSANFLKNNLVAKAFDPYSNEKPGVNNYGLGFRMKLYENGEKLTYHNGWWHGSNAVFVHLLKSKTTIIAIGNKYSNKVYTAMALSSLFQDFPMEREKLRKEMNGLDTDSADTMQAGSQFLGIK